jgi:hypothetical protein
MAISSTASPMAAPTPRAADIRGSTRGVAICWAGMAAHCAGRSVELGDMAQLEFSADGIFAGAALVLQTSAGATIATIRAPGKVLLFAPPRSVHPAVVGGGSHTAITARIVATPRKGSCGRT